MTLRRATPDDAPELSRLRGLMIESMGGDTSGEWREECERQLREGLASGEFRAYVVEADGRLVASGVGWVNRHLPSPRSMTGRRGHIASMSTEPDARGRGHARAIMNALMEWFGTLGVDAVELRATPMGEPLYRSIGFTDPNGVQLIWRPPHGPDH